MTEQELTQTIKVLKNEVEILKGRLEPTGTEYVTNEIRAKTKPNLNTLAALDVINGRIDELLQEALYRADELTDSLMDINGNLDVDGYDEHTEATEATEAMEQARLRRMQDSAAGRKPDIQNMSSDGLSDGLYERSMKQKHGRAVMTVSEMMQEELEPLPINTFE